MSTDASNFAVFTSFTKAEASFKEYTLVASTLVLATFLFLGMKAMIRALFN
jgi:hypothetical protein